MRAAALAELDEHAMYPVHEEDNLPEKPGHEMQVRLLRELLTLRFPGHWVTGNVCMYWERHAFGKYVAPDVLVCPGRPANYPHDVYLVWTDARAELVIETGSKSTFKEDEGPKIERYILDLNVREYVYFRPHRTPKRRSLQMWRGGTTKLRRSRQTRLDATFVKRSI